MKGCKSIRPVILISYLSIGDRGEGIKELAKIITGLINNLKSNTSSFTYIFTKFPLEKSIHPELQTIFESI